MKPYVIISVCIVLVLALIPFVMIAKARVTRSDTPRLHLILDMDNQPKYRAQSENPLFADHRAMRPLVPGTVAHGEVFADDHFYRGKANGQWATEFPMEVTKIVMLQGQKIYGIYCTPCHGQSGYGNGMVAQRAEKLQEAGWTPPSSFHSDTVLQRPVGHIFNTITNGIRSMPSYGAQIAPADRWKVVAFVRALQRSQRATLPDVPPEFRENLLKQGK
jgi:mono/diheme cytochrome c family protein